MTTRWEKLEDAADRLENDRDEFFESVYHSDIEGMVGMLVHRGYEVKVKKTPSGMIRLKIVGEAQLSDW